MRERWCRNCRGWHRDGEWPRECYESLYAAPEPANLPLPFIRRDHMDKLWHPADGKEYESRSDFDAVTKKHGLTAIGDADLSKEVTPFTDTTLKSDIIEAYKKVEQGYKPDPVRTNNATDGWQETNL